MDPAPDRERQRVFCSVLNPRPRILRSSYTPKQRETLLKGFRILTKVAVRAHMKRQEAGSGTAPDDGGGEEEEE